MQENNRNWDLKFGFGNWKLRFVEVLVFSFGSSPQKKKLKNPISSCLFRTKLEVNGLTIGPYWVNIGEVILDHQSNP